MKRISLVSDTVDKSDINALTEWLSQDEIPKLTKGELTIELETNTYFYHTYKNLGR